MDKNEAFEKIKFESQRFFIVELKEKTKDALSALLRFRLHPKDQDRDVLLNYFHSIKGTAAMLEHKTLSEIGSNCEKLLELLDSKSEYSHKLYSSLLEGVAKILEQSDVIEKNLPATIHSEVPFTSETNLVSYDYLYSYLGQTILIVDDDVAALDLLDKLFSRAGFFVLITTNAEEVYDLLDKKKVDLMLLDVQMPKLNGLELFENLVKKQINIPTIFISSNTDTKTKLTAFNLGAHDYIIKPFDFEEVVVRVERVLSDIEKSKTLLYIDETTGAYTKAFFNNNFKIARHRFIDSSEPFAVALLDIDGFREINERLSYDVGNQVLTLFFNELKSQLSVTTQIYRLEADKFIILFPDYTVEKAYKSIEEIRSHLSTRPILINNKIVNIRFSAGISEMLSPSDTVFDVFEHVEDALKISKKEGRNRTTLTRHSRPKAFDNFKFNSSRSRPIKILIIEDSSVLAHLIRQRLETLQYEVQIAHDASKGLVKIKIFKPDIIILDIMLPYSNGFDVAKAVKNDPELTKIKVIVISSQNNKENVQKSSQLNLDGFLVKPFGMQELESRIENLLIYDRRIQ